MGRWDADANLPSQSALPSNNHMESLYHDKSGFLLAIRAP
jgi:hypothetical protein